MQGLSLWQPWAQLIALNLKKIETRSWPPPGARIGQRIAIHAAKRKPRLTDFNGEEKSMLIAALGVGWSKTIPYGAFVCTALLDGAQRVLDDGINVPTLKVMKYASRLQATAEADRMLYERTFGDYTPGRWMWTLADIRPLPQPIPYKGAQRLFEIEGPAADQLARFEAEWENSNG